MKSFKYEKFWHKAHRAVIGVGVLAVLAWSVMVWAAEGNDKTVSMVTYFPVPYAAYNNLYVSQKMDIGLLKNGVFSLNLNSSDSNPSLYAIDAVLWEVGSAGTLSLKMPLLLTEKAIFGQPVAGPATLTFKKNAYVKSIANNDFNSGVAVKSASSRDMRVKEHAYLFNSSAQLPETCTDNISWQDLSFKIGGSTKTGSFLVCGDAVSVQMAGGDSSGGGSSGDSSNPSTCTYRRTTKSRSVSFSPCTTCSQAASQVCSNISEASYGGSCSSRGISSGKTVPRNNVGNQCYLSCSAQSCPQPSATVCSLNANVSVLECQ